jgi:hypothetical protein
LKRHFGQECVICDDSQKKWDIYNDKGKTDDQKKAAGALSPKLRSMYNIERLTDKRKGKNSFMEASDFIFEDELLKAALDCEDGAEPVAFYEVDGTDGKIVRFKRPKSSRKPSEGFKFLDRKKAISKSLLEGCLKFGELIEIPTPEEVKDFYYGGSFIENSEDEDEPEESDEEIVEEEESEEVLEEEDSPDEDTDEPEESEADESDEVEEEEGDRKTKVVGKPDWCPSKKAFGVSYGKFDKCDDCSEEMNCFKAQKKLKK